jgi:hypothetical protein
MREGVASCDSGRLPSATPCTIRRLQGHDPGRGPAGGVRHRAPEPHAGLDPLCLGIERAFWLEERAPWRRVLPVLWQE